jgi:heme-degrading monooxygenase HmoA
MVMFVMKWDIVAATKEEYLEWTKSIMQRTLEAPGVKEFRGYRTLVGNSQVAVTYEFEDRAAWAVWHEQCAGVIQEIYDYCTNVSFELWGPSFIVPKPIRP